MDLANLHPPCIRATYDYLSMGLSDGNNSVRRRNSLQASPNLAVFTFHTLNQIGQQNALARTLENLKMYICRISETRM